MVRRLGRGAALSCILLGAGCAGPVLQSPAAAGRPVPAGNEPSAASVASAQTADAASLPTASQAAQPLFHDVHFHLTNYVQRGITARAYLAMVGDRVGRTAMFGIPLQQKWDHFVSGDRAPDYYLRSNASLYYYSFVDAMIAAEYLSLTEEDRARIDPMITGFNPTDMYAADHIERALLTFPGVFSGIGEFSVHKEFVSSKVVGHAASLLNPALDRILEKAAETGLVVILHCDVDNVRPGPEEPDNFRQLLQPFARHPDAAIIWAHTGLGRFVAPSDDHLELLGEMLADSTYAHVSLDISWDEVAEYVVLGDGVVDSWAALMDAHPTRFIFGTDAVAPADWEAYSATHRLYGPLWERLSPDVRAQVERLNYERIFDSAVPKVRAWERRMLGEDAGPGR